MAAPASRLIADIGGTNARFALTSAGGPVGPTTVMQVRAHATFADALAAYVAATGSRFHEAALAAAGPRDGDAIRLTNAGWTIDPAGVRMVAPKAAVAVFNDLEAVAFALPHLRTDDVDVLAAGAPPAVPAPRPLISPTQPAVSSTASSSFASRPGISPPDRCWWRRPAGW